MPTIPYNEFTASASSSSNLFTDYISFYPKLEKYFNGNFRSNSDWEIILENVSSRKYERSLLVQILSEQNKSIHCSVSTLANIDLLYNENSLAIVTGQQIGILGGPLYTIYKLITCIKLTESLKQTFPKYNFVPGFWAEAEDHDFLEINKITSVDNHNKLNTIEYLIGEKQPEKYLTPVGNLKFDIKISEFIEKLKLLFTETEFTPPLFDLINSLYRDGKNFCDSFNELLNQLFHQYGVIFINPNTPALKQIAKNVFVNELSNNSEVSKRVIKTSAELEENYHAQLKSKSVNLFLNHKGGRYSIEPQTDHYFLKNTRQTFPMSELKELANTNPENFSTNVVLRPIYQDTILPTVAYVAGPSEICYFAQLKSVYEYFDIPMPIIYPRASITLIEKKISAISEKFNLELQNMMLNPLELKKLITEQNGEVDFESLYSGLLNKMINLTNEAKFGILQIDPTLEGPLNSFVQKIVSGIQVLKEKTIQAKTNRDNVIENQYIKFLNNIFPLNQPQERVFNIIYFLNKYGPDFINWIYNEVDFELFEHQLIEIE
ncbi:MAG: bacillithiol biosynthesis cysteine-adding enzyme BshC [Bacteroidetes bacterium]|nr:bacillithiol biosynthesis cysteine-adding enzyme BshC [Bacteroidota bacterium]